MTRPEAAPTRVSYGRLAWCYQELAALYSLGAIRAAKAWQVERLPPAARVLYAGAGRGEDALLAARRGARVTALDCSARMLARLRASGARAGLDLETRCGDFFGYDDGAPYDAVALNFFLDLFGPQRMRDALGHALSLLRPGGLLLIADFAPARAGPFGRAVAALNYWPLATLAAASGLCARHPIHDCAAAAGEVGLRVEERARFGVLGGLYESLVVRRPG